MDFEKHLCRACLTDKNLQTLFIEQQEFSESENTILNMFISCTALEVSINDKYPKYICTSCLQDLYHAYNFWRKCRNSLDELNAVVYVKEEKKSLFVETVMSTQNSHINPSEKYIEENKPNLNASTFNKMLENTKNNNLKYEETELNNFEIASDNLENFSDNLDESTNKNKQSSNCELVSSVKKLKNYQCSKCHKSFKQKSTLKLHMKVHSGVDYKTASVSSCLCQICGCILMSSRNLEEHIESHSNLRKYKCKICSKAYKTRRTLYTHTLIHAEEKKHTCEHCGQKFRVSASLKCHIKRRHSNAKPYVCTICSKAFKFSYKLTIHVRQHTGEKPYACSECSMAFVCSSRLKMHMLKHTGIRNYSCTICDKRFLQPQHLKTHMITHTGECKHKCQICSKAFRYSQMLKNHMKVHGETLAKNEIVSSL